MSENLPVEPEAPPPSNPPTGPSGPLLKGLGVGLVACLTMAGIAWALLPPAERQHVIQRVEQIVARDTSKVEKEAAHLEKEAEHLEKEGKAEAVKLEHEMETGGDILEKEVKAEGEKLAHEASETMANDGEALLSDARLALHEMTDHTPAPIPVETVGDFISALPSLHTPLQVDSFPERPKPFLETKDNPYFGRGYITKGFHSFTGAWWQPQFFIFGQFRSGLQTLHSGTSPRTAEWVNRLDIYANLNVTPTERILIGLRPLDLQNNSFSGYSFSQPGPLNGTNARITTLFYEGNFLSMFPSLDNGKDNWLGFDMSIGRQYVTYQNGILLNDYLDMVGFTRPSMFLLGSSASTVTFLHAWNNVHRSDTIPASDARVYGAVMRNDYVTSTVEGDFFVATDTAAQGGNGLYAAVSATQRLGKFNTSFRLLGSHALDSQRLNPETVGDGALLFAQISTKPAKTDNVLYLDAFWGPGQFTSVSRTFDVGGPLSSTGLLYAETQLGHFGAALSSTPNNSYGGAVGYQIFFDDLASRQVTFELGGENSSTTGYTAGAGAVQYQQSFNQHFVWTVGAVGGVQNIGTPIWGVRSEISVNF